MMAIKSMTSRVIEAPDRKTAVRFGPYENKNAYLKNVRFKPLAKPGTLPGKRERVGHESPHPNTKFDWCIDEVAALFSQQQLGD